MARVKFIRDEEPNILALSSNKKVIDGALYVATDTGSMWLGVAENRLLQINAANLDKDTTYTIHKSGNTIFFQDSNGTVTEITDDNTIYNDATDTTAGLMSAADKAKLDGIAASIGTKADTSALEKEVSDRKAADTYIRYRIDDAISQCLTVITTTSTATSIGADALDQLIKSWPQVILIRTNRFNNKTNGGGFMYPLAYVDNKYYFCCPTIRNSVYYSTPYFEAVTILNSGEGTLTNTSFDMVPIYWNSIASKPFSTIGSGLKVVDNALTVDTSVLPQPSPSDSGIAIIDVDTGTASEHYEAIKDAWPNCLLRRGNALYLPTTARDSGYDFFGIPYGTKVPGYSVDEYSEYECNMPYMTGRATWYDLEYS